MAITVKDINEKVFTKQVRGYSIEEVDDFLDELAAQKGIHSDISTVCLILAIFVGIVAPMIMQDKLNTIVNAEKGGFRPTAPSYQQAAPQQQAPQAPPVQQSAPQQGGWGAPQQQAPQGQQGGWAPQGQQGGWGSTPQGAWTNNPQN